MVLSEEEHQLNKKHLDLCNKLNLDASTITISWDNFRSINKNFVLEGDALHWLGCSVFVASKGIEGLMPTSMAKGNCVNLISLLRHSNLSFAQFFCNINKWAEMAHLPEEFHNKIAHLKDTFGVSYSTFKEYHIIFSKIFLEPSPKELEQSKQHRSRKQRTIPCDSSKVFEFIWNLFVTLKDNDQQYSTELIKSYHLLYACIDLAFRNAFVSQRRDLLNPHFEGLPSNWTNPSFAPPNEPPCIISYLCKCSSVLAEAMHMKMYILKGMMANLIKNKTVTADLSNFTGLFDCDVFEQNFKNVTSLYETQLLTKGDFDERIFLAEYRRQILEQHSNVNVKASPACDPGENVVLESPRNVPRTVTLGNDSPFAEKGFVRSAHGEILHAATDKTTTQKITKLHNILNNRSAGPNEVLVQLFETCQKDPLAKIQNILQTLGDRFVVAYVTNTNEEEARNRLQMSVTLFYKFVENVLQNEKRINKDISALVEKDLFYECMFACCIEIVIFSYSSDKEFPWVLDVLKVDPFDFVKVIELIVRSKDQLSREVIKHLNEIEETVIESLVWKSKSKLWDVITFLGENIPKFEDTALPGHILYKDQDGQCPEVSATDCFQSPVTHTAAHRQLFPNIQAGQSVLQKQNLTGKDGNKKPTSAVDGDRQSQQKKNASEASSKRTKSLSIIFRKFYNLAGVRMEHLCSKLCLSDSELKHKIWTVFEDSIRNTDLIKDRHLDQLLMCAVYVICKVSGSALKFQDIMKFYREQPQSVSGVYRDVLLTRERVETDGTVIAATRSDLIHFYNSVYVDVMQKFAKRFRSSVQNTGILLSPLPAVKRDLVSPSIQVVGNVFVKPLESPSATAGTTFSYFFSRSPSKDLKDINKLVNSSGVTGKRLLIEGDADVSPSKRISNRKLQILVEERRSQTTE